MVFGNHRHLNNINIGDLSPFTKLDLVMVRHTSMSIRPGLLGYFCQHPVNGHSRQVYGYSLYMCHSFMSCP